MAATTTSPKAQLNITPELVTGLTDTGDVLDNLLDELLALCSAAETLYCADDFNGSLGDLLSMAHRKAMAAVGVYAARASSKAASAPESAVSPAVEE